jgi:hypothetical protein
MSKKFSALSNRVGASITGNEVIAIESLAGAAYTASTISAESFDKSLNDSANSFPIMPVGAKFNLSGFIGGAAVLNGEKTVVSSTASKLVIAEDIEANYAAGASVTVQEKNKSYKLTLDELANYSGFSSGSGNAETVYDATGNPALDRDNGGIQLFTLAANTTFSVAMTDGKSMTFHLSGGDSYTVTWPTMTWVGDEPTLTANDVIVLWKVGSTLYAAYVGGHS